MEPARRQIHAFGQDHDGEMFADFFPLGDMFANMLDGEGNFRNEDDMGAAGDAGFKSDPAAVAAHDLNHHHAMMRCGRGVNLVDGIGDGVQRGIESECDLGGGEIVIDGLGHADNLHSLLKKFVPNLLRAVAADGDDGVNAQLGGVGNDLGGNITRYFLAILNGSVVEGIAAVGGAENGAAARQNAAHFLEREFEGLFRPDEAIETIRDADDFPSVLDDGSFGSGANDRIEAGSVAASRTDADTANVGHRVENRRWSLAISEPTAQHGTTLTIILWLRKIATYQWAWRRIRPCDRQRSKTTCSGEASAKAWKSWSRVRSGMFRSRQV